MFGARESVSRRRLAAAGTVRAAAGPVDGARPDCHRGPYRIRDDRPPTPRGSLNPPLGILLKLISTLVFTFMVVCVKEVTDRVPAGQIVFARSFFALVPILAWTLWRGRLAQALRPRSVLSHVGRGAAGVGAMFTWFVCLGLLPLPEAMAFGYASPLMTVILAALMLGETVRLHRWGAVVLGLAGILIMLAPRFTLLGSGASSGEFTGALWALASAAFAALAMIMVRRLVATEQTETIVVYFSILCSLLALPTIPLGWIWPNPGDALLLILTGLLGGVGQLVMTESYRHAEASTIATFDYSSMIWGLAAAWLFFAEVPEPTTLAGMAIVAAAGILIIWHERRR